MLNPTTHTQAHAQAASVYQFWHTKISQALGENNVEALWDIRDEVRLNADKIRLIHSLNPKMPDSERAVLAHSWGALHFLANDAHQALKGLLNTMEGFEAEMWLENIANRGSEKLGELTQFIHQQWTQFTAFHPATDASIPWQFYKDFKLDLAESFQTYLKRSNADIERLLKKIVGTHI